MRRSVVLLVLMGLTSFAGQSFADSAFSIGYARAFSNLGNGNEITSSYKMIEGFSGCYFGIQGRYISGSRGGAEDEFGIGMSFGDFNGKEDEKGNLINATSGFSLNFEYIGFSTAKGFANGGAAGVSFLRRLGNSPLWLNIGLAGGGVSKKLDSKGGYFRFETGLEVKL